MYLLLNRDLEEIVEELLLAHSLVETAVAVLLHRVKQGDGEGHGLGVLALQSRVHGAHDLLAKRLSPSHHSPFETRTFGWLCRRE